MLNGYHSKKNSKNKVMMSYTIHRVLRPLLWVANVPCKHLVSAALFICSYRLEPVQSLRSSTHVRLGLPLPLLPFNPISPHLM